MTLGILTLDTTFDRIIGDIGNPDSFSYPVLHSKVTGASIERALGAYDKDLLTEFVQTGEELISAGATALTTTCGFLARYQNTLANLFSVPFLSSTLCLVKDAQLHYGPIGVITADSSSLCREHFTSCGAPIPDAIIGMQAQEHFRATILEQRQRLIPSLLESETVATAMSLVREFPQIQAIVLECTNLSPYREGVLKATRLPVIDSMLLADALATQRNLPWRN